MIESNQLETSPIDFWGIGVQKCGTTWLHFQLKSIPKFSMLPVKEIHYFDRSKNYPSPNKLLENSLNKRLADPKWTSDALSNISNNLEKKKFKKVSFLLKYYFSNYNDNWYLSLFEELKGYKGEITPSYCILKKIDIKKMYNLSPKAKIVLMVRNPIDRAWSHFKMESENKKHFSFENLTNEDILKFLTTEKQVLRSDYNQIIKNYSEVFPKNQIIIGFFDAIIDDPYSLIFEIANFIGKVSPKNIKNKVNPQAINKSKSIKMPPEIEAFLKDFYYDQIKFLAQNHGGYFNTWLEKTYGEKSNNSTLPSPTLRLS